jgi:hypothetical protein
MRRKWRRWDDSYRSWIRWGPLFNGVMAAFVVIMAALLVVSLFSIRTDPLNSVALLVVLAVFVLLYFGSRRLNKGVDGSYARFKAYVRAQDARDAQDDASDPVEESD